MIKAVLFDLDGTLVNSLEDLAASVNYALHKCGLPTHPVEEYRYFVGNGMKNLIERTLPAQHRDTELYNTVFDLFYNHYSTHFADRTAPYDGIKELLIELKKRGIKIAVVSNKAHEMTLEVIKKLFGQCFDVVYGKCEGYPVKPDPTLSLKAVKELGVTAEECIFVGDSGMDAKTAVNIGCVGVGVLWGFRTKEELLENGAVCTVHTPKEILGVIDELNRTDVQ
ncbi:MAG: HAD family hydrolase [Clostridia bacterium]|nr:HAD family hydrolase [Clostridia bacterium]